MKAYAVTQQQRDNLLDAMHTMWPSVPPENVVLHLRVFRGDSIASDMSPTCGSVACFGGWCAWWPAFRAQGVAADWVGAPMVRGVRSPDDVAEMLFGDRRLFCIRGTHAADIGFNGTDHACVASRLQWLLDNSEVRA